MEGTLLQLVAPSHGGSKRSGISRQRGDERERQPPTSISILEEEFLGRQRERERAAAHTHVSPEWAIN